MNTERVHVSGNTFVDAKYFQKYYVPKLREYVADGTQFYTGGASGVDKMTQEFLIDKRVDPKRVFIYDKGEQDNRLNEAFNHLNGFEGYRERDEALTEATTIDLSIAHQYGGGGSGSFSNVLRRQYGAEAARDIRNLFRQHSSDYGEGSEMNVIILNQHD